MEGHLAWSPRIAITKPNMMDSRADIIGKVSFFIVIEFASAFTPACRRPSIARRFGRSS